MKRISEFKINEKLNLSAKSKVIDTSSKLLKELKKGDEVYIIQLNTWQSNKIHICQVYSDGFIDFDENHYGIQYKKQNNDIVGHIINKKLINDNKIVFDGNHVVISTSKELIEKAVDDNIDAHIQPLQEKIDFLQKEMNKIQDQINDLLKEKEDKYIK